MALVAPASPFARDEFEAGLQELERLGLVPVYDERVFERESIVAGSAELRAQMMREYFARPDIDAILAVRGGYGSAETLPLLDMAAIRTARTAFIGYSDVTAIHTFLTCHAGLMSVHGPMVEGRIGVGERGYDRRSFLGSLTAVPLGALTPPGIDVLRPGEASGPLFGGTLAQLTASLGTPFQFSPPAGNVLLLDEVGERPYRIRRMLTQLSQSGILAGSVAVVIGQLPRCDEPGGNPTGLSVFVEFFRHFPGPVIAGFPTGHTTTPLVSVPLGVDVRVLAGRAPGLVFDEAAAG